MGPRSAQTTQDRERARQRWPASNQKVRGRPRMGRTGSLDMGSGADECKKSPRIGVCTMSTSACAVLKEHVLDAIPQCKEVMQRGRRAAGERRSSSITARPLKGFETGPPRGEREGVLPPDL